MKVKRTLAILVCLMLVFGLFTGCSNNTTKGTIKIGSSIPATGSAAADGLKMKQGIQLAIDEINKKGGVNGKNLEIDFQDDQAQQSTAVNAANKLVSDKVVGVVGPHHSTSVQAADGIYGKAKIPYLTGGTSPSLENAKDEYFHRVRPSDKVSATAVAKFIATKLNGKKVYIMYNNDSFGTGGRDNLIAYFKANNIPYTADGHNTGDKDFTATLSKLKSGGYDTVAVWSHDAETAGIAKQVLQLGMSSLNKVSANTMSMDSVIQMTGQQASEGWYSQADYVPETTDANQLAFEKAFKAKYNSETELYAATYYSATYILANAIKKANSTDSTAINKALSETKGYKGMLGDYTADSSGNMVHQTSIVKISGMKCHLEQAITVS